MSQNRSFFHVPLWLVFVGLVAGARVSLADEPNAAGLQLFERKIRPVLLKHCYECHSARADEIGGGLLLDSRSASRKGGETGPAVVPGDEKASLIVSALEYRDFEMPPAGQLPADVIADFRRWIELGAPDPRVDGAAVVERRTAADPASALWSLAPVRPQQPPPVKNDAWPLGDIDRFVLASLEVNGLQPVGPAEPLTLLRRTYFDLIGLPPAPDELAAFEADHSAERFTEVVDRLLESPQFGERWGRHWLDVVRYGESTGNSRDVLMPYAWRYRDYVIDAFNADLPYDCFVAEQVAGDLLDAIDDSDRDRQLVATGLLAIGSKSLNGGNIELDLADDQIDVIGKAVLGLTISCARCHDHKFDPIPTADYYALAGIFLSTKTFYGGGIRRPKGISEQLGVYLPLGAEAEKVAEQIVATAKRVANLEKQRTATTRQIQKLKKSLPADWKERSQTLRGERTTSDAPGGDKAEDESSSSAEDEAFLASVTRFEAAQQKLRDIQAELAKWKKESPPPPELAVGVRDADTIADSPIHLRGEKNKLGDVVPRGFLSCVKLGSAPAITSRQQSGRLQLARWLTQPDHPLTPRVAVNRIWQHLFGRGIVETADNFGANGTKPSHPELLDYLAHRFVNVHHWSIKSLIREIVLTRTYQLASDGDVHNLEADPGNSLYWRSSRRRLEAEPLRDAMLAASGELNLERPAGSLVAQIGEGEVGRGINTQPLSEPFPHRSVYLPIIRGIVPELLRLFDLPEPSNPQGMRDVTNVPAQSLYLMNSPFVIQQAEGLARRILDAEQESSVRIDLAFRICLSRGATEAELARMKLFLSQCDAALAGQEKDADERRLACWTMLCQSLFAGAEFRYIE